MKHKVFTKVPANDQNPDLMTNGFAQLLGRTEEDFLVESLLDGVPESTKLVIGKEGFTLDDLIFLPRLSDSELTEHGLYIDVVEVGDNILEWKLYVGSASGQFGVVQRWYTYLGDGNGDNTAHIQEIRKTGRTVNLRCIAHFGFEPIHWLTPLAESVFMLYLNTIYDPRITWGKPDYSSLFIFNALYEEIKDIRSDCRLPNVKGQGLNRTWSLLQGWCNIGIKAGVACVDCGRVTVPVRVMPGFA
jgi:hypothetical protein